MPELQERLAAEIASITISTPELMAALLKSAAAKWTQAARAAGIQPE